MPIILNAMPKGKLDLIPARPTALVFASLVMGQLLNFISLSLFSAWMGLESFGRYGICLLDFTIFSNIANFALPAASISLAVRGNFRDRAFSLAMGTRWWTSLTVMALYILFEITFRDREMWLTALALSPTLLFNPMQLEWWFVARKFWRELIIHRCLGGMVCLVAAYLWVIKFPSLPSAALAYSSGTMAATLYLLIQSGRDPNLGKWIGLRLPWPRIAAPRMIWLWRKSLPLALAGGFEFLFIPLGFYAFKFLHGESPWLGGYLAAYRLILAASFFASSLFLVLLPTFSKPKVDLEFSLRKLFDRMALMLILPWLVIPILSRPILHMMFPNTDWDTSSFQFAAWCFSVMALGTYLHLLRMPPLTRTLATGGAWMYFRRFIVAGIINALAVGVGILIGEARWLPIWALSGEFIFTAGWILTLYPRGNRLGWIRVGGVTTWSSLYLTWVYFWIH